MSEPVLKGDFYVGYRAWVAEDDGRLLSQNKHYEWPTGKIEAECKPPGSGGSTRGPHAVPTEDCSCGIYAYYDIKADRARYGELLGVILVWGNIVLHKERLRAQYAEVAGILVPKAFERPEEGADDRHAELVRHEWNRIDAVAKRYNVPVLRHETPEQAQNLVAAEFGRHIPADMLPTDDAEQQMENPPTGGQA